MKRLVAKCAIAVLVAMAIVTTGSRAGPNDIIVQSTTSTANSGLYEHLLPAFEKASGIKVRIVAVGTGQALRNGRAGDGDVVLVHAKSAEEEFVAEGYGVERFDVMYNDFVIVGPPSDPAGIGGLKEAHDAFRRIADKRTAFVSRGDNSGTHKKELQVWSKANRDPTTANNLPRNISKIH